MATTERPPAKRRVGFLNLGGLLFVGIGIAVGIWMTSNAISALRMRSWEELPARILHAELKAEDSGDGTTYRAKAEYEYQFQGRKYKGDRVSIHGGSDNVGSFHQDVYRELKQFERSKKPFRCYVDPSHPVESVLYRTLRWEMMLFQSVFVLVFGGAGVGLLALDIVNRRKERFRQAAMIAAPEKPWLWNRQWASGRITASMGSRWGLWIFAVAWNVMTIPACLIGGREAFQAMKQGNWLALLSVLFPLFGLGLIVAAVVSLLRWRKYGRSVFEMASVPGVIGGALAGVVRTTAKLKPERGFQLKLSCIVVTVQGEDTLRNVVWQDEQVIARELLQDDPAYSAIPVLFQIPFDSRPSDDSAPKQQTIWELEVAAKQPGLDYVATFQTPVFKTPESRPDFVLDRSLISDYVAAENLDQDLAEAGIIKTESPAGEGFRLVFPRARHPGAAFGLTLGAALFGVVPFVVWRFEPWGVVPILFCVVFGFVGLLLAVIALDLWLYRSEVEVSPHGLSIVAGLLGLGRSRFVEASKVFEIRAVCNMKSEKKQWFDVIALSGGKKITLGKRLPGKRLTDATIRLIEETLSNS